MASEIDRLKLRRKRRQEALQALNEAEDRAKELLLALREIEELTREMQTHRLRFIWNPKLRHQALAGIAKRAAKAPLLAEISIRVDAVRSEFMSLAHSDDRELKALEGLPQSTNLQR